MQAAKIKRAQNYPLVANFVSLLQYQWSVSPLILLYSVSSLGVHWNRISLAGRFESYIMPALRSYAPFRRFAGLSAHILRVTE